MKHFKFSFYVTPHVQTHNTWTNTVFAACVRVYFGYGIFQIVVKLAIITEAPAVRLLIQLMGMIRSDLHSVCWSRAMQLDSCKF